MIPEDDRREITFAAELRRLRQRARLTLEGLAEASGVSARTIGGLERGHSLGPQRRTVVALADGLGLDQAERDVLEETAGVGRPRPVTAPAGWCVPPRAVPDFTGRDGEIGTIVALAGGSGPAASVVVLSGPGGIGKTTLAVRAGRRLAESAGLELFYVDLRGMDAEPLEPATALFRLLRALGVGNRDIPEGVDGRSGQLRALLEQQPAVIVLDNARDEEQVRPLLPGVGRARVLLTSRRLLTGLEGVERLAVPALAADAGLALLSGIIGGAEGPRGDGLAELAGLCGGLPLALRIIGNRLATRPNWTARQLADRLADSERRLGQINAGDLQITAAFAMSYDQLTPAAQRLCRRLALVPGPDFEAGLASVLCEAGVFDAEDLLEELYELGMLAQVGDGRYGFHDLIRLFAGDRLAREEKAAERERLLKAMTDWLLGVAVAAGRWFEPDYGAAPADWREPVDMSTSDAATAWLHTEADNWLGAYRTAVAREWDREVVATAGAFHWFSDHWDHWEHWREVFGGAVAAAERLGDAVAHATQLNNLAWAYGAGGERLKAAEIGLSAVRVAEQAGNLRQQGWGYQYAAHSLIPIDPAASLRYSEQADRLMEEAGDIEGRLSVLVTQSAALLFQNRPNDAAEKARQTLEVARAPQSGQAKRMIADMARLSGHWTLARVQEGLGEDDAAEDSCRTTAALAQSLGLPLYQAKAEVALARILHRDSRSDRDGRDAEAVATLRAARERFAALEATDDIAEADQLLEQWGNSTN
ncbi:helix-turn-helix domain-containing protein [Catenulispora sp. NF23]|uniref:XRE family transcriptional regulator n=1 Tax=Catenulispora pinistramenti TaxID=2705254 RepID=UPI001BAA1C5F|nr:XRE family transcriptional regulator [Catenulispora pinistramenti]MBS2538339.1 helix-turn-helix domain-containing protein [Catenulispora pinistramenti]